MTKLAIRPNSSGYTVKRSSNEVLSVTLAGGATRQRLDKLGSSNMVTVKFMVDENGYQYLNAFFNTTVEKGSLSFQCDLLLDKPYLTEHTCKYVPGSFSLESNVAFVFNCNAQFEVMPLQVDEDFDNSLVAFYGTFGNQSSTFINLFNKVANITMPGYLV